MKKVSCYETTDGQLFKSQREADGHQEQINLRFRQWYEDNKLYGDYAGSKVEFSDLDSWLQEHRQAILDYLK